MRRETSVSEIEAIDVHAHFGSYSNRQNKFLNEWMSGDAHLVVDRAGLARTSITIVSPLQALMPRGHGDVLGGNETAARAVADNEALRQWVVIDPRNDASFQQAAIMLEEKHCVGIKIHPEEHLYPIAEHGEAIFRFAAERGAVILTHSGEQNSMPRDFVPLADRFPEVKLILAHLGCGWDDDPTHQVRAVQAARNRNVWVDTSSATSILPGLIEWAVAEISAERLLYGTDSPLYFASMQRARIDDADIPESAKRHILRDNAVALLEL